MQFVLNGPNIPETLLHAHEQGRVVFFCGAGISYSAGLPGFKGLVDRIYSRLYGEDEVHSDLSPYKDVSKEEHTSYDHKLYDATLDLLERRHPGHRTTVRVALMRSLVPELRKKGVTDTHRALLKLSATRSNGKLRLVTTNFDRIFEKIAKREKVKHHHYKAPHLPRPQTEQWDGIVYLHGLLPNICDEVELEELIVTSGDFGRAYLTEGWAARFVTELFQNYIVCFVGYSIEDPILRYMMDALAADKMRGEKTTHAFAFGDFSTENKEDDKAQKEAKWRAKGVEPILYKALHDANDHSLLHRTLHEWAGACEIEGKERIIRECAYLKPSQSTQEDNFVGRVLWAISDSSGSPAKLFASLNPVPAIEWLAEFSNKCFTEIDLNHFGISADKTKSNLFSLLNRPAPHSYSTAMAIVSTEDAAGTLDSVMSQLAHWLTRHLNDPELIIWIAEQGGCLHATFARLISRKLDFYAEISAKNNADELESIRKDSPNAIPSTEMRILWRFILSGRACSSNLFWPDNLWAAAFKRDGLTACLRLELRRILTPKFKFTRAFRSDKISPKRISDFIQHEITLASSHIISDLSGKANQDWQKALPLLLKDFQDLLEETLDIASELENDSDDPGWANFHMCSIENHPQNDEFAEWIILIKLLRDAWLSVYSQNPSRAKEIAMDWIKSRHMIFKRLALFAANQEWKIKPPIWTNWLIDNNGRLLWSSKAKREVIRLIVKMANKLPPKEIRGLECAILKGRGTSIESSNDADEIQRAEYSMWFRLSKLKSGDVKLGRNANYRLKKINEKYPKWKLNKNDSDEFNRWIPDDDDLDWRSNSLIEKMPNDPSDIIKLLRNPRDPRRAFDEEKWCALCKNEPDKIADIFITLAKEKIYPAKEWRSALYTWGNDLPLAVKGWNSLKEILQEIPTQILVEISKTLSWFLYEISKSSPLDDKGILEISTCILNIYADELDKGTKVPAGRRNPTDEAINHPVGHITETVLNIWYKRKPNDNVPIPSDIEPIFTKICNTRSPLFIHGRVLLASHAIPLFRADRSWAERQLLPCANWSKSSREALHFWAGFLWSPRIYLPLMGYLKNEIIETVHHYGELNKMSRAFADFITYAALSPAPEFGSKDYASIFCDLPTAGLESATLTLVRVLEAQGESAGKFWQDKILPFWRKVWPKSDNKKSEKISESLVRLAAASKGKYRDAVNEIINWIIPIDFPYLAISAIDEANLFERFPEDSLKLLNAFITDPMYSPDSLADALAKILKAQPEIKKDPRYKRLSRISKNT